MKAERAWLIPYKILEKLGTFEFARLRALSAERVVSLMSRPNRLHRFPAQIGNSVHGALAIIERKYRGDAGEMWAGKPSSADVAYRFLELPGVGIKIATMAANILARTFKIPFSDYYSIDISPDRHVRRVFERLGLTRKQAPVNEVIYRARALNPEFPGLLDSPIWHIGREWCGETPRCPECYMRQVCPTAGGESRRVGSGRSSGRSS